MGFLCSSKFQNPHMPKHFTYSFACLCLTMGNHSSQINIFFSVEHLNHLFFTCLKASGARANVFIFCKWSCLEQSPHHLVIQGMLLVFEVWNVQL
jgi:hypothetical protein